MADASPQTPWRLTPFRDGVPLAFDAGVTTAEADRLRLGLTPEAMEDKWVIHHESPHLFFHRSWTGRPVYRVTLEPTADGARLHDARWSADLAGAADADPQYEARVLQFLVFQLQLRRPGRFPLPTGIAADDVQGLLLQHHVSGTAFPAEAGPAPVDPAARRPRATPRDVITTLRHFAIVTYAIPPERLAGLVDDRFELDTIALDGGDRALISVVPFEDQDFRWATSDGPRWRFGQTNYRVYVRDRQSGRRVVWFLGTTLGSWRVVVPRYLWRLPWHYGRFALTCEQDTQGRYTTYRIETRSRWAPLVLELEHRPDAPLVFAGFGDTATALDVLTHPLDGFYRRRDGRLGTYSVWHERLTPTSGRVRLARIGLLDRLGIVPFAEQRDAYSVLIQERTEFQIHLPPRRC
jgi:hypothetical protein